MKAVAAGRGRVPLTFDAKGRVPLTFDAIRLTAARRARAVQAFGSWRKPCLSMAGAAVLARFALVVGAKAAVKVET